MVKLALANASIRAIVFTGVACVPGLESEPVVETYRLFEELEALESTSM